jgi:hypothetical protein
MKNMKKNKKAWLRVVEASIAVIVLIGFALVMANRTDVRETTLQEKANSLALEIEKDGEIREKIFENNIPGVLEDVGNIVGDENFALSIDENDYGDKPSDKEIFAASIMLAQENNYKEFTLYIWQ